MRTRLIALIAAFAAQVAFGALPADQKNFKTPEQAVAALVKAAQAKDKKALVALFGPLGEPLVDSGDPVADQNSRGRFLENYNLAHSLDNSDPAKVILVIGAQGWPFPIPLTLRDGRWFWNSADGAEEIINRRIGENELDTIQSCLAYVDAQREYYLRDPDKNGLLQYARTFASTPGKRDGLYWPTKEGEPPSPLGPFAAQARAEGYSKQSSRPIPYWGYYFRILTAQGNDAPGGAYDYLAQGRMIGGFALVAFPARYGVSGIMTFIVNHDGVVYQKDLGPNTAAIARAMKEFNPDTTWKKN